MAGAMPEPDDAAAAPPPRSHPGQGLRSDDQEPATAGSVSGSAEAGGTSKAAAAIAGAVIALVIPGAPSVSAATPTAH